MRKLLLISFILLGCGGDDGNPTQMDAATQGSDASADSSGGGGTGLNCQDYCTAILARCTGAVAQYSSMANCVDSCSTFEVGTAGAMMGNTLACRVTHVDLAAASPTAHCGHAGPSGGTVCGATLCEGFCSIVTAKCPTQFPTSGGCATICSGFSSVPPYSTASSGDSAECRLYHATMAATAPGSHCSHTVDQSTVCQ
ncbi:MAG TPA: hypothetical protein VIV40_28135 [Kofleriaceae bacterium]